MRYVDKNQRHDGWFFRDLPDEDFEYAADDVPRTTRNEEDDDEE